VPAWWQRPDWRATLQEALTTGGWEAGTGFPATSSALPFPPYCTIDLPDYGTPVENAGDINVANLIVFVKPYSNDYGLKLNI